MAAGQLGLRSLGMGGTFPAATQANRCNQESLLTHKPVPNAISMPHTLVRPLESEGRFVGPTRKPTKLLKIQVSHKTYSGVNIVSPARTFPAAMTPANPWQRTYL